ncbi:MAG: hypothetical protein U0169_20190 [Polyangiaceae bacterium]
MADRHASIFGPILPVAEDAPEAFTFAELQRIRARLLAREAEREAIPESPRFRAMLPRPVAPGPVDPPSGARLRVARVHDAED